MLQQYSRLKITDNSGAKEIMVIQPIQGARADAAKIGDVIVGVVKDAIANGQVKQHEKIRAVIVRTKHPALRADGSSIVFDDNAAVIISNDGLPRATRILGPVARELREKGFSKIVSLAPEIL